MQFGVLGPLRVLDDQECHPIMVSAARLRVLLGVLLWRMNQPVGIDELAEMVWDGAPPRGAAAAVRALVMRLRRVLGQGAGARIVTRAPGYQIELANDELDASRFEVLSREAGSAVRARRWADARNTAAAALGLWRGAALADISSQALRDAWVPFLEQGRVQALEWRIEADLQQGRHLEVIEELREVSRRYPLREHFRAQVMLALARAARQAEALAVYHDARRLLLDELGVEPGPELRHVYEQLLAGDVALTRWPSSPGSAPRTAVAAAGEPRGTAPPHDDSGTGSRARVLCANGGNTGVSAATWLSLAAWHCELRARRRGGAGRTTNRRNGEPRRGC
jgi:DNA-binding SARP family transcriptional activator